MYRWLKLAHVFGFALFLGSILAHVVTGRVHAGTDDASLVLYARDTICIATRALTAPGLLLLMASGVGMLWLSRGEPLRQRWMQIHLALGAVIAGVSVAVVVAVAKLAWAAEALAQGHGGVAALALPGAIERYAGAANIVMILVTAGLAIVRPWRQTKPMIAGRPAA